MKKWLFYAVMLLVVTSCTKNEEISSVPAPVLYGYTEDDSVSRTEIETDSEGVGTIWWNPGDEINVFIVGNSAKYHSINTEKANEVEFITEQKVEISNVDAWALYPYDTDATADESSVTTTIPFAQQGVQETFDTNLFPMLARAKGNELRFKNVCGGVKFTLSRDDIKRITFRGNNNEDLTGKVRISMDENGCPVSEIKEGEKKITLTPKSESTFANNTNYFLVMLPGVLSKGFTMTFETELLIGTFEYTEKAVTIKRSIFSVKENIDTYATFVNRYSVEPFTITSAGDTTVAIDKYGNPNRVSLEYRKGENEWNEYTIGANIDLSTGETVQFRAENTNEEFSKDDSDFYQIKTSSDSDGKITVSGNIMSLIDKSLVTKQIKNYMFTNLFRGCTCLESAFNLVLPTTTLANWCYFRMFSGCANLTTAPELPATTLVSGCYGSMFDGCTRLTTAPKLPATTLADYCYRYMFEGCASLTVAPKLPATTLADQCYYYMFYGCTNLITAPELPATTLAESCYRSMFNGCTNLTTAPELPATTLASGCYQYVFNGCTSLISAPELPATTLADGCYYGMFHGCTNLTTAPELPATTLAESCYWGMFEGCASLTAAPKLPATTLADQCYYYMFHGCTSLTIAPELPVTTLAENCYNHMFYGCTSLTTAPELPATTLAKGCYQGMFWNCTSLTTAPELPATTLAESCYNHMFYGCTNLTTAPALPATTLASYCYSYMFGLCKNLTSAPELLAPMLVDNCYSRMFYNCPKLSFVKANFTEWLDGATDLWLYIPRTSSTGTFECPSQLPIIRGTSNIPNGWEVRVFND